MDKLLRRLMFVWTPCATCRGYPFTVSWSDPYGCWDCRNLGMEPHLRRPWTFWAWSRRWAWRIGPIS